MDRQGINSVLLKSVLSPPSWVTSLRNDKDGTPCYFLPAEADALSQFMNSTTDSVRLVRASQVSRRILATYDLDELEDLRATVQLSELLRVIPYASQTDHSAHTLYVYLLGIYLFFACLPLRLGIASFLGESDKSYELLVRFLFQWVFASLLHDVGYLFQGRSRSEIRAADRMFRASTIARLLGYGLSAETKRKINTVIGERRSAFFESIENPEDMLSALSYVPWGERVGLNEDTFETFSVYGPPGQYIGGQELEEYAYQVASSGYDGQSEGIVDHAIASGLFLLRYSSLWFWVAKESRLAGEFSRYRNDGYPQGDVVAACMAAAGHNLIGVHAKKYRPLVFDNNPILYLGVLCDELQKWDRFPAGERHLGDLQSFDKYCTDSERITLTGDWDGDKVILKYLPAALAVRVKDALGRLESSERFVEVAPS